MPKESRKMWYNVNNLDIIKIYDIFLEDWGVFMKLVTSMSAAKAKEFF